MNRKTIIILVACGIFIVVAVVLFGETTLAIFRAQAWEVNPSLALETAHTLIDYELPDGYQEQQVLMIQEVPRAVIISHRSHPGDLIALIPIPSGIIENESWRTEYEEQNSRYVGQYRYETKTINNEIITVRGQSVNLRMLEGRDQNGVAIHQAVCLLEGKTGELMLIFVASQATWDQMMINDFIQSIR